MPELWQVQYEYKRIREKGKKSNFKETKRTKEKKKNEKPPFSLFPKALMIRKLSITNFSEQLQIMRAPLQAFSPWWCLLRYPGLGVARQQGLQRPLVGTELALSSLPCLTSWHSFISSDKNTIKHIYLLTSVQRGMGKWGLSLLLVFGACWLWITGNHTTTLLERGEMRKEKKNST